MKNIKKKHSKYIAMLIAIVMLIPMLVINIPNIEAKTPAKPSTEDARIASEISNTTGVEVEEILMLKNTGKTWNEVLNILKTKGRYKNEKDKTERNNLLTNLGIGEDYVDKLKEEGYSEDEIMEAKLFAERAIFQLNEITKTEVISTKLPNQEAQENKYDDISAYTRILEKIDLKTSTYLILKLKEDIGSLEGAFDEYLCALQLDIDIEEYFMDKEAYENEKNEKSISFGYEKIITLAKIEEKMLKKLQSNNAENGDFIGIDQEMKVESPKEENESDLPLIPEPNVQDVKPVNPRDEIMDEIKVINPNDN